MNRRTCAVVTSLGFVALALASSPRLHAQDEPSIDRLLSKLPPPEKLVKRPVERALNASDPAVRDPLVKSIAGALRGGNAGRALALAKQLTTRYPRNPAALTLRGMVAIVARQFGHASSSFREAIAIQPKLSTAHFGLALVEAVQNRYAAAMPTCSSLCSSNRMPAAGGSRSVIVRSAPAGKPRRSHMRGEPRA